MTALTAPPCPNCGGVLRPISYDDSARCRCGLEVSAVAIVSARTKGRPLSVADGRFVPIPQAAPGIRVGRSFTEVTRDGWDARQEPLPAGFPDLAAHAERYGATLGLRLQRHPFLGKHLVVGGPDGHLVQIEREMVYALCRPHEVMECTERMVEIIAAGGPGNWWATAGAVHAIADDGLVRFCDVGGEPHIYLRALYGVCRDKRDLSVIRQAAQDADRRTAEAVAKFNVELYLDDVARQIRAINPANIVPIGDMLKVTRLKVTLVAPDPLDVEYDGVPLRDLVLEDTRRRREGMIELSDVPEWLLRQRGAMMTPTQRAAVSDHWSAQLRAKAEASRKAECEREVSVRYCEEDEW